MPRRILVFVALSVALAALFVRLGFWQLGRLAERKAQNVVTATRMAQPEAPFSLVSAPPGLRRAVLVGVPDTAREFVVTGRSRNGSPGVHIITPVRVAGGAAVLVNRGWVYAADAVTADLTRWRESRVEFHGYTQVIPLGASTVKGRGIRPLSFSGATTLVSYPVAGMLLVSQDSQTAETPARLPAPALDEGPHLSYAIQWFCFAAIAVVGSAIVARRSRVDSGHGVQTAARD